MPHYTRKHSILTGFTLLELLVALAIFSVISAVAYQGLSTVLTVREHTEQQAQQLAAIQMTFMHLGRDIQLYIDRSIRDEYGEEQPSIQGRSDYITFTRAGWHNPLKQPRATLQRVSYYLKTDELFRVYWRVLDRAQDSHPIETALLKNISALELRFLDENFKWYTQWPPIDIHPTEFGQEKIEHLLYAIEITLNTTMWGEITRLFAISSKMPIVKIEDTLPTKPSDTDSFVKVK